MGDSSIHQTTDPEEKVSKQTKKGELRPLGFLYEDASRDATTPSVEEPPTQVVEKRHHAGEGEGDQAGGSRDA